MGETAGSSGAERGQVCGEHADWLPSSADVEVSGFPRNTFGVIIRLNLTYSS